MSQMTYGYLKERVLDCLFEHESENGETILLDDARNAASLRMADIMTSCLVRMFETLSVGRKKAHLKLETSEKTGFVKAELPEDFSRFDGENSAFFNGSDFYVNDGYIYVDENCLGCGSMIELDYRAMPPKITSETDEGFVIELSPLAAEALICLCALELCRPEDTSLYTKLYYKYNDLCMGLGEPLPSARKNSFFSTNLKKRWAK